MRIGPLSATAVPLTGSATVGPAEAVAPISASTMIAEVVARLTIEARGRGVSLAGTHRHRLRPRGDRERPCSVLPVGDCDGDGRPRRPSVQIRFFESDADVPGKSATDPRARVLMLIVITATLFGSLEAIREGGGLEVAVLVTVGLAVSILPILLRVLPTLRRDAETHQRDPHFWITVLGPSCTRRSSC
jgi:hypothetical protein